MNTLSVRSRRRVLCAAAGFALLAAGAVGNTPAGAAGADYTITVPTTPGSVSVSWTGTIPVGASVILVGDPLDVCNPADPTKGDRNTIKFIVPPGVQNTLDVTAVYSIDWDSPSGGVEDEKLVVLDPHNKVVGDSDTGGQSYESTPVTHPESGIYTAIACPFQNPTPKPYKGKLTVIVSRRVPRIAKSVTAPTYRQYEAPPELAGESGEPSIGVNWKSGAALFQANQNTYKVTFSDATKLAKWTDVTGNTTGVTTLDPILWTDSDQGRTFVSQLLLACSAAEYTDDDGGTWVPSQGCGEGTGIDHQSVGGGPYPSLLSALGTAYPHAVYYCTNGIAAVTCGRSDDGGVTFLDITPAMTTECGVLHGHIRVAPDGTVYIPATSCQGKQGVAVSDNAGLTWTVRTIPDSIAGTSDPAIAAGKDNTAYFGFSDGSGKPKIAVSRDRGKTWAPSVDVGIPFGINSTEFAEVIAGDGDRAAFAFLGTPTDGDYQGPDFGLDAAGNSYVGGTWHMYVATTYNRGKTWTTVDATPTDPVQRGCMWNRGGGSKCRNLLDFNDITIDKTGRVLVGFADGCTRYKTPCTKSLAIEDNSREAHGAILRQMSGKTLFKAYDGALPGSGTGSGGSGGSGNGSGSGGSGSGSGGNGLPSTGGSPWPAVAGAALLLLALIPARRRRLR